MTDAAFFSATPLVFAAGLAPALADLAHAAFANPFPALQTRRTRPRTRPENLLFTQPTGKSRRFQPDENAPRIQRDI